MDAVKNTDMPLFRDVPDVIQIHGDTALLINSSEELDIKVTWVTVKKDGQWRIISMTFTLISQR